MAIVASGLNAQWAMKRESVAGVLPAKTGATGLSRTSIKLTAATATHKSTEVNSYKQTLYIVNGVNSLKASISQELAPGKQSDILAAVLQQEFAPGASATGLTLTVAAAPVSLRNIYTVARGGGSWLSDGFKAGSVVTLSGGTLAAANTGNLFVVSATSAALTVKALNNAALTAQSAITGCTAATVGKRSWMPSAGQTDVSFALEKWQSDICDSLIGTGLKPEKFSVDVPSDGIIKATTDMQGMAVIGTAPTAISAADVSIAAGAGAQWILTRAAGDWIADGVVTGNNVALTGPGVLPENSTQLRVISATALTLTVAAVNAVGLTPQATITGCSLMLLNSQYFTTPSAPSTSQALAATTGVLMLNGQIGGFVTSAKFNINSKLTPQIPIANSGNPAFIYRGVNGVTGSLTVMFTGPALRTAFLNADYIDLHMAFARDNSSNADFLAFSFPKTKLTSNDLDDGDKTAIESINFESIYNAQGGAGTASEKSTIAVQDSSI